MTKLVYIGGYGHSGSTLIEYLMTGCRDVIACGEVAGARGETAKTRMCSCGRPAEECPVWSVFFHQASDLDRWRHENLELALLQISKEHAVMVDSSKTAWNHAAAPFRFGRKLRQDFVLIHMVRDPRGVCWSLIKRNERARKPANDTFLCISTALGWCFANLACELFSWIYPNQYRRVRYEDLARSSHRVLTELVQDLLPEGEWRFEHIGTSDNRHQLFGNRMRLQLLSPVDIREDDAWRTSMPTRLRWFIRNFCWPLSDRYDYR
jgi:hypothetical protein